MTSKQIIAQHPLLLQEVRNANYYPHLLNGIPLPDDQDVEDIVHFWNVFWQRLPDSTAIRRHPFSKICDIAEGIFAIDDEEDF